ncbi:MAG: hypothetical protein ACRDJC_09720 [Thermomicrobiales bacterium]
MDDSVFDRLTRPAATAVSHRTSFLALGGAGLAAVAAPAIAMARKAGNVGMNVRKLLQRQREQCRTSFAERCQGSQDCLEALLPCCEPFADCSAPLGIEWISPIG